MVNSPDSLTILHSFPADKPVFKEFCELTFDFPNVENVFVGELNLCTDSISGFDLIIIHYLRDEDCEFLYTNKLKTPTILFAWGADFFNLGKFYNAFLLPKTFKLRSKLYQTLPWFTRLKKVIHTVYPEVLDLRKKNKYRIGALSMFDAITPVMPGDYHLLKKKYPVNGFLHHLNYVNPNLDHIHKITAQGDYILLGNSASFTNNHIEAIDRLTEILPAERKVLLPLSYGDKSLADYIEKYAFDKLGHKQVKVLRDFMPIDAYQQLISKCEIVVMNHLRQQAVGNIVQALSMGAHVYLQDISTVFSYLKERGFIISAFNKADNLRALHTDEKDHNINLTFEVFGKSLQHKKISHLIEQLTKKQVSSAAPE